MVNGVKVCSNEKGISGIKTVNKLEYFVSELNLKVIEYDQ